MCGKSARWWDSEVKDKINSRRKLYVRDGTVVGGQRRGKFGKFSHSGRVTGKFST